MRNSRENARKCSLLAVALIIPVIVLIAACGGGGSDSAPASETSSDPTQVVQSSGGSATVEGVKVIDVVTAYVVPYFRSDPIVLKVGEPVQFKLSSFDTRHTFTITELDVDVNVTQKLIGETAVSQVIIPQQSGTFRIWCRIHLNVPLMEGTLQVVE